MKVMLTEMHSIRDSLRTMYMSKRTWNQELEKQLKKWSIIAQIVMENH